MKKCSGIKTTPLLKKRLIASLVLLIPLMYVSMGHMMWNWPLPSFFDGNHVAMGLVQLLLTVAIMVINQRFLSAASRVCGIALRTWTLLWRSVRPHHLDIVYMHCLR